MLVRGMMIPCCGVINREHIPGRALQRQQYELAACTSNVGGGVIQQKEGK